MQDAFQEFQKLEIAHTASNADDAVHRWLRSLSLVFAGEDGLPPFFRDVATYEHTMAKLIVDETALRDCQSVTQRNSAMGVIDLDSLRCLVPIVGKHVLLEHFLYNAPAIVVSIENCDRIEPFTQPDDQLVLIALAVGEHRPFAVRVNAAIRDLLSVCDGQRNCAEVAERMGALSGDQAMQVYDAIERLRAKNIVTYLETRLTPGNE
jgi:hypothetical protein